MPLLVNPLLSALDGSHLTQSISLNLPSFLIKSCVFSLLLLHSNHGGSFYESAQPAADIWSNVILGMSGRVFLDDSHIWIGRLGEADGPSQCGWVSSNLLRAWIEPRDAEFLPRLTVFGVGSQSSPAFRCGLRLDFTPSALLVHRPANSDGGLTGSLGLQPANCRFWDFLASKIAWANSL